MLCSGHLEWGKSMQIAENWPQHSCSSIGTPLVGVTELETWASSAFSETNWELGQGASNSLLIINMQWVSQWSQVNVWKGMMNNKNPGTKIMTFWFVLPSRRISVCQPPRSPAWGARAPASWWPAATSRGRSCCSGSCSAAPCSRCSRCRCRGRAAACGRRADSPSSAPAPADSPAAGRGSACCSARTG